MLTGDACCVKLEVLLPLSDLEDTVLAAFDDAACLEADYCSFITSLNNISQAYDTIGHAIPAAVAAMNRSIQISERFVARQDEAINGLHNIEMHVCPMSGYPTCQDIYSSLDVEHSTLADISNFVSNQSEEIHQSNSIF